jgi:hypothetical protein
VHTHAIPILVDHALTLSLLVIFSLIIFLLTCTISARRIPGSFPPMPLPLYRYPSYYILNPLPYYQFMTLSPLTLTVFLVGDSVPITLTIVSVCDSVPPLPLPYYRSLTQFPSYLPISVLPLTAWSVLRFLMYINPTYHSCIL